MSDMDAARIIAEQAVIAAAGPAAQRLAGRPRDGWVPVFTRDRAKAIHEAGHAIAAIALGQYVLELSIVPRPERCLPANPQYFEGGHCTSSRNPDPLPSQSRPPVRDRSSLARWAWLLTPFGAPGPRWKRVRETVRMLQRQATAIVETHWIRIMALACELERRKVLGRPEIERVTQGLHPDGLELLTLG